MPPISHHLITQQRKIPKHFIQHQRFHWNSGSWFDLIEVKNPLGDNTSVGIAQIPSCDLQYPVHTLLHSENNWEIRIYYSHFFENLYFLFLDSLSELFDESFCMSLHESIFGYTYELSNFSCDASARLWGMPDLNKKVYKEWMWQPIRIFLVSWVDRSSI